MLRSFWVFSFLTSSSISVTSERSLSLFFNAFWEVLDKFCIFCCSLKISFRISIALEEKNSSFFAISFFRTSSWTDKSLFFFNKTSASAVWLFPDEITSLACFNVASQFSCKFLTIVRSCSIPEVTSCTVSIKDLRASVPSAICFLCASEISCCFF